MTAATQSQRREYLDLAPVTRAQGTVELPGSKSISNRLLLLAALSSGATRIEHLLQSDDTAVMLQALRTLGLQVEQSTQDPRQVVIHGQGMFPNKSADLFLGNAGTAFRPLTAALAFAGGHYHLHGVARMHERPIGDLVDALRALGCEIECLQNEGYPPLQLKPSTINTSQPIRVRGDVSSQFLTALLMASVLRAQDGPVVIEVIGELISKPYIQITLSMMQRFGITVQQDDWQRFTIAQGCAYVAPQTPVMVEGDASSASYFIGLGMIGGGSVRIEGAGRSSIQGDIRFAEFAQSIGARIDWEDNALTVSGIDVAAGQKLKAFDQDFNHIPDAAMTAAALALFADGPCTLRNIASWRVKETDRIAAMAAELTKVGAHTSSTHDSLTVTPPTQWRMASIHTYDDHRMAMCLSLAAFGGQSLRILDPDCVAKTFPTYFEVYDRLVN